MRNRYTQKREMLVTGLREAGFQVSAPEGSYYLFANYRKVPVLGELSPMKAALFLLEQVGVASVPGDNFYHVGNEGDSYLRFAFCRCLDTLQEAIRRLMTYLS